MATRTTPQLLLLVLLLSAASPGPSLAEQFVVGDRQHWAPNVNYTVWADQYHFHLGDWLVFYYEKDMYDVVQVNGTAAYESCDASHPIRSYSRGRSYAFQLNETGRHYFICSRGYCWAGMKVSLLVEPPSPPPSEAPSAQPSSANSIARFTCSIWRALTVIALPFSAVWFA